MQDYINRILNFKNVCLKGIKDIKSQKFESMGYYDNYFFVLCFYRRYCDLLKRVDDRFLRFDDPLLKWAPLTPFYEGLLIEVLEELQEIYENVDKEKTNRLIVLTPEERKRMNEAFHCLMERCYWSSVVNSAVALESRLLLILRRRNTKALKSIKNDLSFTLGQLADAYLSNKGAFHNCIPRHHEHLLKLVNQYRIVSAHPMQFQVTEKTANAIFNFTLDFLLDKDCEPPKKKGKKG